MKQNFYIGHSSQLSGVEEVRLIGGKGDGMRLLQVRNGKGLELTVSADRCADISRVIFKGDNMGYFSPCGYVAPAYYEQEGAGFLKSFTAGFMTTCGLTTVGAPCEDCGEQLPLHGNIANQPCEHIWWTESDEKIEIHATINDSGIFSRKLVLNRLLTVSKENNAFQITDTVENQGDTESPLMLMYHMNMGYPLLSENAEIHIHSDRVIPATEHAAKDIDSWDRMLKPTSGFEEQCYFHEFDEAGSASIFNREIKKGAEISFSAKELPALVEWKMMGCRDYVLGLEPRNCLGASRRELRESGNLPTLLPGKSKQYKVDVSFSEKEFI